jgi:hypothetical protein
MKLVIGAARVFRSAMRSALIAACLVLAMAGTAAAQPGMTVPSASPPPPTPQQGEELSESTAVWLSLGGTAASWTLLAVASKMDQGGSSNAGRIGTIGALGTLFAPSFGHWYARSFLTRGLGLRVAGAAAAFFGLSLLLSQCEDECSGAPLAGALMLGGAGLYVGGTIDDIAAAPGKVRQYNQRFQNVVVAPMIRADGSGLMIAGRF